MRIDDIKLGSEMDRHFAKLIGWQIYHYDKDVAERCYYMLVDEEFTPVSDGFYPERKTEEEAWEDCPKFSTTWEGMSLVVEEMQRRGYELTIRTYEGMVGWIYIAKFNQSVHTSGSMTHSVTMAAIKALQGEDTQ